MLFEAKVGEWSHSLYYIRVNLFRCNTLAIVSGLESVEPAERWSAQHGNILNLAG